MIRVEDAGIKLLGASLGIVPCRARSVGRFVAFSTFVSTTSGLFFGQIGALLGTGPLVPYLVGAWAGYSLAGVIFWRGEVKRALKFVQAYPRLMEHALLSSGDHGESQTFKYERDTDLTTWIRADGCSRWLRTARMSTPRRPRASTFLRRCRHRRGRSLIHTQAGSSSPRRRSRRPSNKSKTRSATSSSRRTSRGSKNIALGTKLRQTPGRTGPAI